MSDFKVGDMVEYNGDGDRGIVVQLDVDRWNDTTVTVMWDVWTLGKKVHHHVRSEEHSNDLKLLSRASDQ
jgi:hypothetical protein